MSAVVSVEVHLLDLAHERVSGVSGCALVVERLLGHSVESVEEVLLVYSVVADGLLYAYSLLESVYGIDKSLELLLVGISAETQSVCNFSIAR